MIVRFECVSTRSYKIFKIYINEGIYRYVVASYYKYYIVRCCFCCCEYIYIYIYIHALYSFFLSGSSFRTFAFPFAIFGEPHLTLSMSNAHLFRSLTPLVILSRTKICAKVYLLLVQTLSLLNPFRQTVTTLPSTVTFGGWCTLFVIDRFEMWHFSMMRIPLSLSALSPFVLLY